MTEKKLYRVTLSAPNTVTWHIEATSPEEAEAEVRAGEGTYIEDNWDETPVASVEEIALAPSS